MEDWRDPTRALGCLSGASYRGRAGPHEHATRLRQPTHSLNAPAFEYPWTRRPLRWFPAVLCPCREPPRVARFFLSTESPAASFCA